MSNRLIIKQVRSVIRKPRRQRLTMQALGLRRMHQTVEHNDTPQIRGMIDRVSHLVAVEPVAAGAKVPASKTKATRAVETPKKVGAVDGDTPKVEKPAEAIAKEQPATKKATAARPKKPAAKKKSASKTVKKKPAAKKKTATKATKASTATKKRARKTASKKTTAKKKKPADKSGD